MNMAKWIIKVIWVMRILILITGFFHLYRGEWAFFSLCLLALLLAMIPVYLSQIKNIFIPMEVELILLWWIVADVTIGRLFGLFESNIWYDKVIHLLNTGLFGAISFLSLHTLNEMGQIKNKIALRIAIIFIMSLGIGAFWEILEYFTDLIFHMGAQGSPLLGPRDDTMWDLTLDGIGGLCGCASGYWYVKNSTSHFKRIKKFMSDLSQ